ncbi:MAG: hypothetical protein WB791_10890 [Waddliaceae bacterium]
MASSPEGPDKEESPTKEKLAKKLDSLKENENLRGVVSYAQEHTADAIAYLLMIVGIIWMLFQNFYGGVLVGLVAGYYFHREVLQIVKSLEQFVEQQGLARSLILGATLFALFLMAPGIFVGAAIMIGLMLVIKRSSE